MSVRVSNRHHYFPCSRPHPHTVHLVLMSEPQKQPLLSAAVVPRLCIRRDTKWSLSLIISLAEEETEAQGESKFSPSPTCDLATACHSNLMAPFLHGSPVFYFFINSLFLLTLPRHIPAPGLHTCYLLRASSRPDILLIHIKYSHNIHIKYPFLELKR